MRIFLVPIGFLFALFFGISFTSWSQISWNKTVHDFGTIEEENPLYTDFLVTNTSSSTIQILRIANSRDTRIRYSTKTIKPDSTAIIRIKYNPHEKGKFKSETPVYFGHSTEPLVLTLKGNIKYLDPSHDPNCPDFKEKNIEEELSFELTIKTIDALSKKPVPKSNVKIILNGLVSQKFKTDKNGELKVVIPLNLYYFVVNAEGYKTSERAEYVNRKNNELIFELEREPREDLSVESIDPLATNELEVEPEELELNEREIIEREIPIEEEKGEFDERDYAPNNIVFLIDASSSMKREGRLDLLKASMIELLELLRPIDRIAVVTYSDQSRTVLESRPATDKELIKKTIQELSAHGKTAGGLGIKRAYKVANHNFIKGGNNQVIIATDGAFNKNSNNVNLMVKYYATKDISISVVGINNEKWTEESMQEIANLGKGNYIHVDSYEIAKKVLVNEIKAKARREGY